MKKYNVLIEERLNRWIEVEAEDEVEAESLVEYKYKNGEIVLTADDFYFYEIYEVKEEVL